MKTIGFIEFVETIEKTVNRIHAQKEMSLSVGFSWRFRFSRSMLKNLSLGAFNSSRPRDFSRSLIKKARHHREELN